MPAETNRASNAAPARMTGADSIGIRSDDVPRPPWNIGASTVPIDAIIANKFKNAAMKDIVAT